MYKHWFFFFNLPLSVSDMGQRENKVTRTKQHMFKGQGGTETSVCTTTMACMSMSLHNSIMLPRMHVTTRYQGPSDIRKMRWAKGMWWGSGCASNTYNGCCVDVNNEKHVKTRKKLHLSTRRVNRMQTRQGWDDDAWKESRVSDATVVREKTSTSRKMQAWESSAN